MTTRKSNTDPNAVVRKGDRRFMDNERVIDPTGVSRSSDRKWLVKKKVGKNRPQ